MAWLCAASGWPWSEVGAMTIPDAMAMGRAWKKVPPLPLLLNGVVNVLTGRAASDDEDETDSFGPEQQAKFDEWMSKHLEKVQAEGGAVSNLVIQAQGV